MSWPLVKLSDIGEFRAGFGFPEILQGRNSGDYPFAKVGDVSSVVRSGLKYISSANHFVDQSDLIVLKAKPLPVGSIVFAKIGEAIRQNFRAVTSVEMLIDNNTMGLVPNLNLVSVDYLYHFMCQLDLYRLCGATTVPSIRKSTLEEIPFPLPPLLEQKRIAAILDKADAIRRKRQQAIKLADDFLRSVFLEMFGDPVTNPKGFDLVKIGDLCEDLFLGLTSKVDYVNEGGVPLVRAKDISGGELVLDDVKYISVEQHKKLTKNHLTKKGDLLISKSGTLGTCAIVREDIEFSTYESIFTFRPNKSLVNVSFVINLLRNESFKEKLLGGKVGGTVFHLNLKMFRDFEVPLPPIDHQLKFEIFAEKMQELIAKNIISGKNNECFFNALSQKAFSGNL